MRPENGIKKFRQVTRYPHLRSDGMTSRNNGGTRAVDKTTAAPKSEDRSQDGGHALAR